MSNPTFETKWDDCWSYLENQPWYPDEQVVRFLARYVARKVGFGREEVQVYKGSKPVGLDLGCGKGRHLVLMCELAIEAFGSDVSQKGLDFAKQWLRSKGFAAELHHGSMSNLPYDKNQFDFVICHGVLDHSLAAIRTATLQEVERILKPGGYFFFSVISEEDSAFGKGNPLEEKTWLLEEGIYEKGIPQAFFSLERIQREFSQFHLESIVKSGGETIQGRSLIGTDKHYAKDSRYYVTAQKKK